MAAMQDDLPGSPSSRAELEEEEPSETEDLEDARDALLRHNGAPTPKPRRGSYEMTPQGRLRAYWLGIVVCIGGFLCKSGACCGSLTAR